ncbi:MAG: hypothetical protein ACQEVT_14210 [Pseudomonadota bacterium]|uniref:hypothetical protein n=1 Tax=Roseovarius TaxID=74030 RepID=UPI002E1A3C02
MLFYPVFPQIQPRQIRLSICRLDSNLLVSAMIGGVGAGGIGIILQSVIGTFNWS